MYSTKHLITPDINIFLQHEKYRGHLETVSLTDKRKRQPDDAVNAVRSSTTSFGCLDRRMVGSDSAGAVSLLRGAAKFPRVKELLQDNKLVRAAEAGAQHHLRVVSVVCSRIRVFHPSAPDILTNHTLCTTVTVGRSLDEGLHESWYFWLRTCVMGIFNSATACKTCEYRDNRFSKPMHRIFPHAPRTCL